MTTDTQSFSSEFGFTPNQHELRIANGLDPLDESLPFDAAKWKATVNAYRDTWRRRGQMLAEQTIGESNPKHLSEPNIHPVAPSPMTDAESADAFACRHRGSFKEVRACDLCSLKGQPFDVLACELHGECSALRRHSKVTACASCQDREANEASPIKLTIGIPTADDAMRTRWTIRVIQEMHPEVLPVTEFLIIDNDPGGKESKILRDFAAYNAGTVRVVDCPTRGTFPPKAMVFDVARGDVVLLLDSHVVIKSGGLRKLLDFYSDNPTFDGLIHGPILTDGGTLMCTHQERSFGGPGIGQWGNYITGVNSSVANPPGEFGDRVVDVPMSGNWCWATLRKTWPRESLPKGLRGYGGDEHLDGLFHKLGRRVVILESLTSWHDYFHRSRSQSNYDKLRNDLLWLRATGEKELEAAAMDNYQFTDEVKQRILREIDEPTSEVVFTKIFAHNGWGGTESVSGSGSSLDQTAVIRHEIPKLLAELGAKSLLDIPCGDHHWMSQTDLSGIDYVGADIVGELIAQNHERFPGKRFERLDILTDQLPRADVVLIRDCLVHFPFYEIRKAIKTIIASGAEWLLATTFPGRQNRDIKLGEWRPIDMTDVPFGFPTPTKVINEKCTEYNGRFADKSLGLWRVKDLLQAIEISDAIPDEERTMHVVFRATDSGVRMDRTTYKFPKQRFQESVKLLANDLMKAQ